MMSTILKAAGAVALVALPLSHACAATRAVCPRPGAGSIVAPPVDLFSHAGVLNVTLDYKATLDADNRTLFCFMTPEGLESPTLHVQPGDTLMITLRNKLPALPAGARREVMAVESDACGAPTMDATSANIHFHGTNTSPTCHSDEVVHTLVNSGDTFRYRVTLPRDEPPGLYWYHPHVHGISEGAVLGGASGAIIVDGIEKLQPAVAKLPSRVLLIRDQSVAGNPTAGGAIPSWDLSLNYVPIAYPALSPALIVLPAGRQEFWRVVNAAADSITDLQLTYDGVAQPLKVVAFDGVATGSQDGTRHGKEVTMTDVFLPPAGRAEFIITAPLAGVRNAVLKTLKVRTGPDGDNDTARTLARLVTDASQKAGTPENNAMAASMMSGDRLMTMPEAAGTPGPQRFEGIDQAKISTRRVLYFSEVLSDPSDPNSPTNFFITVDGATPKLFNSANKPAIVTTQGAVEEWTIENRALEAHEFHIHQIHFKLVARNGATLPADQQQFFDTVQVPSWSGKGAYPSVTLKMDFRGHITGDFVYHCHILQHEDAGMMAIIRVNPKPDAG